MSGKLVGLVFEHYPGGGGGELLVALTLADIANDDGGTIFPSISRLASLTRQSERTVQGQLKRMREMGWLVVVRKASGPGRDGAPARPCVYRISPVWLAAYDMRIPEAERPKWMPSDRG